MVLGGFCKNMAAKMSVGALLLLVVSCQLWADLVSGQNETVGPIYLSVCRTTPLTTGAIPVQFPEVVAESGQSWSQSDNTIHIASAGIYFFNMNAGAAAGKGVNFDLKGTDFSADVLRVSTIHEGVDTLSRGFISKVQNDSTVSMNSEFEFALNSDSGRETSLTVIDLSSYLDASSQVIFSAARRTTFNDLANIEFGDVLVNEGNSFGLNTTFTAPAAGTYFFILSVGTQPAQVATATIFRGPDETLTQIYRTATDYNGQDTIGTSLLVDLGAGETVYVQLEAGELYSDNARQTYFGGFRINPVPEVPLIAWSVYRTNSSGAADPLLFDGVYVNTGDMYNVTDGVVNITQSGLYYVALSVGAVNRLPVDVFVVRDRTRAEMNIYRESAVSGLDTLSHGLLLRFSAGNKLRVVVREGSAVYSDPARIAKFSGFYISP